MFVRYFAYVSQPWTKTRRRFLGDRSGWLPSLVEEAYEEGEWVRTKVGLGKDLKLSKDVAVKVGKPLSMEGRVLVPVDVEAARMTSLFPTLQADLAIEPLGLDTTKLTLTGTYEPPLGLAGALLDRALLHHVAEAVVKKFVDRIAAELGSPAARPARERGAT